MPNSKEKNQLQPAGTLCSSTLKVVLTPSDLERVSAGSTVFVGVAWDQLEVTEKKSIN